MFSRTVVNAGVNEDVQKEGVRNELSDRSAPARTLRCINLHVPDARRTCHSVCAHLTHARINTLDYALASDSQKQTAIHFAKDLPNMMSLLTADIKLVDNILIKLQLISWYRYNPDYIRISSIKTTNFGNLFGASFGDKLFESFGGIKILFWQKKTFYFWNKLLELYEIKRIHENLIYF